MPSLLRILADGIDPDKGEDRAAQTADPVAWTQANFYIPELDGPIKLYPYQQAALREAHRRDDDGRFVYNVVVWSDVKKSAKSSIAAAVALYRAHLHKWGSIKVIANDLKQADSRVAYYLRRAVSLNPAMQDIKQINYKTTLPNQATIEAIPIDPGGEAGGNDDLIIFSELWAAKHKAIQQMWTEMTISPTKFGHSQRWVETYAGYSGESPILEQLYDQGVGQGEQLDLSYTDETGEYHDLSDLEVYANGGLLCLWNTRPRLPWQTDEYYASEARVLTAGEFQRVHRNQWISSTEKFVPDEWWHACRANLAALDGRKEIVLALDAAVSGDCFAIAGVTRDVKYDAAGNVSVDKTAVRYARKWTPPKNGTIQYSIMNPDEPDEADKRTPEWELRRLIDTYNVICVCYDEYQLHDFVQRLRNENIAYFKKFAQGNERAIADKQLYDCIRERTIEHDGDSDLAAHIANANQKAEGDNKLRIVKRTEALKIDLAVATSMANATIRRFNM